MIYYLKHEGMLRDREKIKKRQDRSFLSVLRFCLLCVVFCIQGEKFHSADAGIMADNLTDESLLSMQEISLHQSFLAFWLLSLYIIVFLDFLWKDFIFSSKH